MKLTQEENMKLTQEEKEIILAKRKKEDLNKPQKVGYSIEPLFYCSDNSFELDDWLFTLKERNQKLEEFIELFGEKIPAGTKFVCFLEEDGCESWYDDIDFGIENMPKEWAEKHLRDIKPIKRKIKK